MAEGRQQDHELNRFWNALVHSASAPDLEEVDPLDAETLRQIHIMAQAPPPSWVGARVDAVMRGRMTVPRNGRTRSGFGQTTRLANQPGPNGPTSKRASVVAMEIAPPGRTSEARVRQYFATACLLLLTLVFGYLALSVRPSSNAVDDQHISAPVAAVETVLATTLPSGEIPDDGVLHFTFWRSALDPGARSAASPEGSCCQGPQITHVLSGELTVHVDGTMRVFRASDAGLAGATATGTDVVLRAGDSVIHDVAMPSTYTNYSGTPAQIVTAGLVSGTTTSSWGNTMHYLDGSEEFHQGPFPAGPVAIDLVRATLLPDREFPAPPAGSLVLEVGESGDASVGKSSDGSLFNISNRTETIYIIVVEPMGNQSLMPS